MLSEMNLEGGLWKSNAQKTNILANDADALRFA